MLILVTRPRRPARRPRAMGRSAAHAREPCADCVANARSVNDTTSKSRPEGAHGEPTNGKKGTYPPMYTSHKLNTTLKSRPEGAHEEPTNGKKGIYPSMHTSHKLNTTLKSRPEGAHGEPTNGKKSAVIAASTVPFQLVSLGLSRVHVQCLREIYGGDSARPSSELINSLYNYIYAATFRL
ncbi:hypothetical protein EVAR_37347_1 [Eumeta japonica]|uniref:Uncharacterized protein n=1 Tax=Eumeta variegata TaxID=151549 RepID=A0A4C1WZX6_EUMVA|nr:hypothetical protein EVAR_37347_1 [Eumeta japonica]